MEEVARADVMTAPLLARLRRLLAANEVALEVVEECDQRLAPLGPSYSAASMATLLRRR